MVLNNIFLAIQGICIVHLAGHGRPLNCTCNIPFYILPGHGEVLYWLLLPHMWAVSVQVGGAGLDTSLPGSTGSGPQYDTAATH